MVVRKVHTDVERQQGKTDHHLRDNSSKYVILRLKVTNVSKYRTEAINVDLVRFVIYRRIDLHVD